MSEWGKTCLGPPKLICYFLSWSQNFRHASEQKIPLSIMNSTHVYIIYVILHNLYAS